ncbi:cinnamoyl-Coa reductase [Ancistrocladus abbreviatus]
MASRESSTENTQMASKEAQSEEGNCLGWAARDATTPLSPYKFNRRAVGRDDVSLKITHCGVCHGDILWSRNEFNDSIYPVVPGHEIAGIVQEVGANVKCLKVGDPVGVGFFVNSCRDCEMCKAGLENHCLKGVVITFNSVDRDGTITKGGFSDYMVVHQRYVYRIPDNYPLELAAPLLCAGLTVYAPMKRHKMNVPGKRLGVIGLGGLGFMAAKFGKAWGLDVTVLSTTAAKKDDALNLLAAANFVVSTDEQQMKGIEKSLDFLIDTASGTHSLDPYLDLLKPSGIIVIVGAPSEMKFTPNTIIMGMITIAGSAVAGVDDTQEMLEFCAAQKIYPIIEKIPMQYINEAFERILKKDIKYRFVIDIENTLK